MRLLAALDAYLESLYPPKATTSSTSIRCARPTSLLRRAARGRSGRCGALRIDSTGYGEVKRMYVHPGARGRNWGARS